MIDRDGYRPNVGIILVNSRNQVFWGKRIREHSWQFPQGGIKHGESPEQAMYRELMEEVGLRPDHVRILGRTRNWLRYDVPETWVRREWRGNYRGQKQIWYLLRLTGRDSDVCLRATQHPEFDAWRWHDYWIPLESVIEFKREVYRLALSELSAFLERHAGRAAPRAEGAALASVAKAPAERRGMRSRAGKAAEGSAAAHALAGGAGADANTLAGVHGSGLHNANLHGANIQGAGVKAGAAGGALQSGGLEGN